MPSGRVIHFFATIFAPICCLALVGHLSQAQQPAAQVPSNGSPTIHAETRLVVVDTVVTDKKGNYVRDLTAKDFKVWEDNKEQAIKNFSFEENSASPDKTEKRYLVLFFDNSTMDVSDQMIARQAAPKFIDANASPNRLIAIVDFGGTVRIAQNFTADAARLKQVVAGLKTSAVSPNAPPVEVASLGPSPIGGPTFGMPQLSNAEADFGARSVMLALRSLAKSLGSVPGRKTLVMLTSGFPITPEIQSELTAVIAVCNRYNVAIYPLDVRGLVAPGNVASPQGSLMQPDLHPRSKESGSAQFGSATFSYTGTWNPNYPIKLAYFDPGQHGGSGGGGGGGHGGGSGSGGGGGHGTSGSPTAGGTRSTGSNSAGVMSPGQMYGASQYNQPRLIVPQIPDVATNQQILYELAQGTGGFVIANSNDLLGGMQRIANDQSQYYVLSYTPPESPEGSCHTLRVKVERGGTQVRSRSGYCNVRPKDLLAGNPIEKEMETRVSGEMAGNVTGSMEAPYFYTSPNTARVNLAIGIPSNALKFEKVKGKQHSAVNVLGIAYKPDGAIAARFSDTVNFDFEDKKELEQFQKQPYQYQNQFDVASGQYTLKVVFSSGNESFGKLQLPLAIDAYDGKQFSMSGVALSNQMKRVADLSTGLDSELLGDRTPLVVQGVQVVPSASNRFKKSDNVGIYAELYAPLLTGPKPPLVGVELIVTDRKTGEKKVDVAARPATQAGSAIVPMGIKVPVATLNPGSYRVELRAIDSVGNSVKPRTADFELE